MPTKRSKKTPKKRRPARTPKARPKRRLGAAKEAIPANVRLLFVEQLMQGFKEVDLRDATRRLLGMGPRATEEAVEAVRKKWLERGAEAPAEALRTRELVGIDEAISMILYEDGELRDPDLMDMPSLVKLFQLRDRVTERLLKNEDQFQKPKRGFLGVGKMEGAERLAGEDDIND